MMNDRQFAKNFSWMIFFLVLLTIVLILLGIMIGGSIDSKLQAQSEEYTQQVVARRTQPVGALAVAGMSAPGAAAAPASSASAAMSASGAQPESEPAIAAAASGEAVYNTTCHICHNPGITGAPKPGDVADWRPRIDQGIELLYQHSIAGYQGEKGIMPPKGGNPGLSDAEVQAAVDYLVGLVQ